MDNLATPEDVRVRVPGTFSEEQIQAALADASAEMRAIIGRDDLTPDSELTRWTCVLAASYLRGSQATGSLGMVAGLSQHTQTIDGYTEGWANYSGNRVPGLSLPPDITARLRATYGNTVPYIESRPGMFG